MEKQHPLIIVFYLDRELLTTPEIINPFVETVNETLALKDANIIALFLPTNGDERVECINPVMVGEAKMVEINQIINDIKMNFSIGVETEISNEEIVLEPKPCECGDNPNGNCKCD